MKGEDKTKLAEVFSGSLWEADLLKSMLDDNGIASVTKDAMVVNITLPVTAVEVAVLVNEKDLEAARKVVSEYKNNKEQPTT